MVAANNNNNGGGAVLVETTQRRPFSDLFTLDSALGYVFECEEYLRSELRINLNKPKEMCKSYYNTRYCQKGSRCPNKHLYKADEKTVVCKHWLRGLCKKGDKCEFL